MPTLARRWENKPHLQTDSTDSSCGLRHPSQGISLLPCCSPMVQFPACSRHNLSPRAETETAPCRRTASWTGSSRRLQQLRETRVFSYKIAVLTHSIPQKIPCKPPTEERGHPMLSVVNSPSIRIFSESPFHKSPTLAIEYLS